MEFFNIQIQATRPDGKDLEPFWVTTKENLEGENSGEKPIKNCTVMTKNRVIKVVPCNNLYPFICTRNAVIRCPNGCFHNGDCVGATCFCHRGWTGRDCSQFHCNDVHNCSGNGQCVGPNVCKCTPGFLGRGCTYSYCTKFQRCSTCSQDAACGWCDSLQQCVPGTATGPYAGECPDWFYYTCYTIGSVNHCSNKIQSVDCTNRQCNYTQETTNSESCQKCHDLEKCFNKVEKGKCRAWNETLCPHGLVEVDYTDPNRIESTLLRSNVKVINPNTTILYSCPVLLPGHDDTTSVFVAPGGLDIRDGDVLTSAQAGGVMHKVNMTTNIGPYTIILGSPAKVEDVIQYADFSNRISPVRLADKSTVDLEPDVEELKGLMDGSLKLNNSDLHVLPSDILVFKCVGHIYVIDDEFISTQFLVLNKDQAVAVKSGDVIVSAQSHGFIEKVTGVNHTSDMVFVETELERCTENSTWNQRFKPRNPGSPTDNDVLCTGGDNSYGLIITEPSGKQQQISVNGSLIGRRSKPFIAKVVESHVSGDFVLVEVLHVQAIVNGTAVTAVEVNELKKEHRRHKRDIDTERVSFSESYPMERKLSFFGKAYVNYQQTFKVYQNFIVKMGVFTDRDQNGDFTITDALFGVEMVGSVIFDVKVQFGFEVSFDYLKKSWDLGRPVQLADFCIFITGVCIPSGLFFSASLDVGAKASGKVYVPINFASTTRWGAGGFCTRRGGCRRVNPEFSIKRNLNSRRPTAEGECAADCQVVPKLTLKVPTFPRYLKGLVNSFNRLWKKVFKEFLGYSPGDSSSTGDFPIVRLTGEVPIGLKLSIQPCEKKCLEDNSRKPNKFTYSFGFSEVVVKVGVGFGDKNYDLVALNSKLFSGNTGKSYCLSCGNKEGNCGCPTTPPPTTTEFTTALSSEKTTATQMTTLNTDSSTPYTGSTTPYTGSTTPYTGSTPEQTTPPPTTPPPCECEDGTEGFVGPDGHCNCPPECDEGKKPVFVNNRYRCPEHPPCGEHPNCVVGRKGQDCSQPDVQPCSADCSGNGVAISTTECSSRCECSVRWTGNCCETRRPWRNWGDPHLETLDGIEYDYYGIGEFWGCKSLYNDFGIQFRYFAYQRASLTGGVAVKAGQSVLSIIALNTSDPLEFPKLRIDGSLVNITAHIGKKMKLNNGTVVMDIQKAFSSELDESGIVLISLQFESGLTVTADVRHSYVMGRQYLNVLFTPTVAFKDHTEGLCGVMDNDPSNDLRGSNGRQYSDPIKFAESWRITAAQNNSGLKGTWSWNSSNFHGDDVMDSSYTDPDFVPVYSLDGIDDVIVAKATEACSSLGLTKTMLQSCIYDVAITNDTSLTSQETLQQDCPDQCSGKGRCVNSTCQCMIGWSGENCQLGNCTSCSEKHGECIKGFCECDDGWQGLTCEEKATCYNVNNCTSPINGICRRTDECWCHDGYIGRDCSIVPSCCNVSECSRRGICVDYDVCKCQPEWTGNDCTQYSCASLDHCSGHGRCAALYKCDCDQGWTGVSCALPDCAGANHCSGQGECVARDTCQCYPGFQGANCSKVAECTQFENCSGNGVCTQEKHGGNLTCRCFAGFSGANCSIASCLSVNNCSGHGLCVEAGLCKCDVGYTGSDCANASCEAVNYCSGHGVCIGFDTCVCDRQWHGAACSVADCSSVNDCSNKGDCILPDTCACYAGYDGAACNTTAKPNVHAPVFAAPLYNVSVSENVPMGTRLIKVQASDADSGRNAQLFYSLIDGNIVSTAFTIDSISGEIFTSSALDYESSSPHLYKLKIVASDNGSPQKSSFVFAYVTIVDENDNCPVFKSLHKSFFNISQDTLPGTLLTVISADDKDSGRNGEVRFGISTASDFNGAFGIGEENGEITVGKGLKLKEYRLFVVSRDLGVPSCSRQIELTVNVHGGFEVTEEPSRVSTADATEAKNDTTTKTTDGPFFHPTSSWYKHPAIIIGISVAGFAIFVLLLLVIVLVLSRKWKRKVGPRDDYPLIRGSRLGAMAGSREHSGQSTPDCNIVEDLEMESVAVALHRIRATEQFEMKRLPHLDF